jgi:broad specificity phosphatase PhoE
VTAAHGLILIRHALTVATPEVPSRDWALHPDAAGACAQLAEQLEGPFAPVIVASTELKAERTAELIAGHLGLRVETDNGLCEVERPWLGEGEYEAAVARYLAGEQLEDWEPREAAVARFSPAIAGALAQPGGGTVLVVSHGLVVTLFMVKVTGVEPMPFWQGLAFPDAIRVT